VRSMKACSGKQGTHAWTHLGSAVLSETEAFSALQLLPGHFTFSCIVLFESHCKISMIKISKEQA
jgi:hypothetical protein